MDQNRIADDGFEERRARLRQSGIEAREALTEEERNERSERIVRVILASEAFRKARIVMLYRSVRGEARLDLLPEAAPEKRYVYPLCVSRTDMIALSPNSADAWRRGAFGIPEPLPEESEEILPEEIDLVICPCTAFDGQGGRLGMGGGYYDRFLPKCTGAEIFAAAFEVQRTDKIPRSPWDVSVSAVITEEGIWFSSRGGGLPEQ